MIANIALLQPNRILTLINNGLTLTVFRYKLADEKTFASLFFAQKVAPPHSLRVCLFICAPICLCLYNGPHDRTCAMAPMKVWLCNCPHETLRR